VIIMLRFLLLILLELAMLSLFRIFFKGIFFTQAIYFLLLTSALLFLVTFIYHSNKKNKKENIILWNLIIAGALGFSLFFVGVVPTMADRSISVYLLASINSSELTQEDLLPVVGMGYMDKSEMDRRISEQIKLGNVKVENGIYYLSPKGKFFDSLDKVMVKLYDLDPKYATGVK
jgi:hypothetical protein